MERVFASERIRFVNVSEQLVGDYLLMVNDHEHVNRFLGGDGKTYTEEQEVRWVRKKLAEEACVWSMLEKGSGEFIGNIELMDADGSEGELGIAVTAAKQDRGFGTEAVSALLDYGFGTMGLARIFLRAHPDNARALRVYTKCGFREYDRTDRHVFMEITRQDRENADRA